MGPWLTTVVSTVAEVRWALLERSRHTISGSSAVVSASFSRTRVALSPAATDGRVHTIASAVSGCVPGPLAAVKSVPRGALTVTVAPATGRAVGLVTMIREG